MPATHASPYAGSWYPAEAAELNELLDNLFARSRERTGPWLPPDPLAFVVPHAGPMYSGAVAAAAYRCLDAARPSRVILLGFSHRGGHEGIAVPDTGALATPLGTVAFDRATMDRLALHPTFERISEHRVCDHSVEIQVPFLQRAVPGAEIVPVYVGRMDEAHEEAAAEALAAMWEPGTVYVASSDLTHYGRNFGFQPFPVDSATSWRLRELDLEAIDGASSLDAELFRETLAECGATVCGTGPIQLLLRVLSRLAGEEIYQETLDYGTSGDITGDFSHCVSYGALGYFRAAAFRLGSAAASALLASAEGTFDILRSTGRREPIPARGVDDALCARRGVFVSLHAGEELLGCVGRTAGRETLGECVAEMTLSAALDDPRFSPASKHEGPVQIEISVLGPTKRIRGPASVNIGRHGALLKRGAHRGLLLPQVAARYEWDAEQFLGMVSRKAGLGTQAWRDPKARLYVFEAQVVARAQSHGAC